LSGPTRPRQRVPSNRRKLATLVRERLLHEIRAGTWRPGDRLPTEPELIERFGVSRTPVREAMQSLSLLGVVDISPRRGATVRALPPESVIDYAILAGAMSQADSIEDVFEFRLASESAIAELAARQASDGEIDSLRRILTENELAVAIGNIGGLVDVDIRLHAAIAVASRNAVFLSVVHALNGLLVQTRRAASGVPGAPAASLAEHRRIVDAIAARTPRAARTAARIHLQNTRSRYEQRKRRGR